MKRVFKYRLELDSVLTVPTGRILAARMVDGIPETIEFWVETAVSPDTIVTQNVHFTGTGSQYRNNLHAVTTVFDDPWVWHLLTDNPA